MGLRAGSGPAAPGNPRYFLALLVLVALGGPCTALQVARCLWPIRWTVALLWVATEWCFYAFYFRRTYEEFNKIPADCKPKGFTPAEGHRNWRRFMRCVNTLPERVHPEDYLCPWFCNAPYEAIKRDNVAEMLVYGFYYSKMSDMTGELAGVPGQLVDQLEAALHVKFPPGYTPGLRFMSHLWEPLRAHYRPLCLYLFFEVLAAVQRLLMSTYGFQVKQLGLLTYYTLNCGLDFPNSSSSSKQPASINEEDEDWTPFADPNATAAAANAAAAAANPLTEAVLPNESDKSVPVLFLHGVGGLMLYLEMLVYVIRLGHPVVVVEYKHVAMRLSSYIPSVDEVTEGVVRILDHECIQRTCIVGHSYGSFMASRLNSLHRERIHGLCLIDPVCLGMFMPHLLHNFMYRRPRIDWKNLDVMVRDLVLWFASRDVHISATFARNFYWTDLNLWPEDLPPNSCIVLSGNDDLCHAEQVQKMVAAAGTSKVILNPHLFHGAFLLDPATKANVAAEVRGLLATSGSLVVRLARPVVNRTLSAARSLLHEVETLTSRISIMSPSHPHRQQQQPSPSPSPTGRQLRRTLTDLPANAWQRFGSFGRGSIAARAAAAAAGVGSSSSAGARRAGYHTAGSRGSSGDGSESWEDLKQRSSSGEAAAAAAAEGGDAVQGRDVDSAAAGERPAGGAVKGMLAGLWQQVKGSAGGDGGLMRRAVTTPAVVQHSKQQQQQEPLQQQLQREAQELQKLLQRQQ
ncbi:hypothetical protein OEZ85_000471 [Tetradesmus obliquus]|uniref:AB hydrolase-1 domain-containing protein n=1 Tax=Tetradesmus obliquus TaxID=3088 RepID=A0ABY8UNN4_TETOB|nr:hypothetical protein OEZ85_000471 [Tetradesmus obliquus]